MRLTVTCCTIIEADDQSCIPGELGKITTSILSPASSQLTRMTGETRSGGSRGRGAGMTEDEWCKSWSTAKVDSLMHWCTRT